ncbi:MAG: hypothetical protein ACXW2E_01290 [Nitrososphaeraceae archaeon]
MHNYLIDNASEYANQYVTVEDFGHTTVLTASTSAIDAYNQAIELGFSSPVLLYIPEYDCIIK